MTRRSLLFVLSMAVLFCLFSPLLQAQSSTSGNAFSAVPVNPVAMAKAKSQGKAIKFQVPNSVNNGRKFSPGGTTILPLTTDKTQKILVLFVRFTDAPPGGPINPIALKYYDDMLFGKTYNPPEYKAYGDHPTDRTLKNFYKLNSYGNVDVVTLNMPSTMGWITVPHPYSYYCNNDNGYGPFPNNAPGLVVDAINAIDPYVDFSQYAVGGEVPNLFVVHAGSGAEWNGDPRLIWSHSWSLSAFNAQQVRDGVTINHYAMMPEIGGDTTNIYGDPTYNGPFPPTVGVFAHEYGHVLGIPDQYDYGYESEGTGPYTLMAGGSWNQYPSQYIFSGNSPSNLDAWSKYRLGFVKPIDITSSLQAAKLRPSELYPDVYRMVVPNSAGKEYYLFENRQHIGFDEGLKTVGLGTHGLAIYHVDDAVLTRNYWRPNEAENWQEFRSLGFQRAWTGEMHYGVSIIQADDRWELERGEALGAYQYSGDLYPGHWGMTEFSSYSYPNTSSYYFWANSDPKYGYSGVTVKNINEANAIVTADYSFIPYYK